MSEGGLGAVNSNEGVGGGAVSDCKVVIESCNFSQNIKLNTDGLHTADVCILGSTPRCIFSGNFTARGIYELKTPYTTPKAAKPVDFTQCEFRIVGEVFTPGSLEQATVNHTATAIEDRILDVANKNLALCRAKAYGISLVDPATGELVKFSDFLVQNIMWSIYNSTLQPGMNQMMIEVGIDGRHIAYGTMSVTIADNLQEKAKEWCSNPRLPLGG